MATMLPHRLMGGVDAIVATHWTHYAPTYTTVAITALPPMVSGDDYRYHYATRRAIFNYSLALIAFYVHSRADHVFYCDVSGRFGPFTFNKIDDIATDRGIDGEFSTWMFKIQQYS